MNKILILSTIFALLCSVITVNAQSSGYGFSTSNFFKRIGNSVLFQGSGWELGSSTSPIAKGYFGELFATTSTLNTVIIQTGLGSGFSNGSVLFTNASGTISQNNTNLFWDDTNRRLGIGTSTPQVNLHIFGATPSIGIMDSTVGGSGYRLRNGVLGINTFDVYDNTSSTSRLVIGASGAVGIATTTPGVMFGESLTINGAVYAVGNLYGAGQVIQVVGNNSEITALDSGSIIQQVRLGNANGVSKIKYYGGDFQFSDDNGTTTLVIADGSGNIGIATTTPSYPLDVVGHALFNSVYGNVWDISANMNVRTTSTATYYAVNNTASTTSLTAGTNYMTAVTTSGATSTLTVGSLGAGVYNSTISVSIDSDTNLTTLHCHLFKNGTIVDNVGFERKIGTAGDVGSASGNGLINLVANDVIDVRCESDKAGAVLTLNHFNINMNRISR